MSPDRAQLEADIRHLAGIYRPSASEGEREAAEWIAERLRAHGLVVEIERESAHGGYWWPLGLLNALTAAAGLNAARHRSLDARGRVAAAAAAVFAGAGLWDDLSIARHWFRRWFLPHRSTWNVVAEAGDRNATHTLLLVAHHDAPHSGLIFAPGLPELLSDRVPMLWDRLETSPPLMYLVVGGPLAVALGALTGARRLLAGGTALALGSALAFADIGFRRAVPGANDNLSGVATLLGVARAMRARPPDGIRVLLLSTGSEESLEEGMRGFAARHFASLAPERTHILVVDTVGSPRLALPEAEGMLRLREYDAQLKQVIGDCAGELGIELRRGLRFSFTSDAYVGLRYGYRTALLGSINRHKAPANYHWPSDTADNVDYSTVADAVALVESTVHHLAERARDGRAPAASGTDGAAPPKSPPRP